VAGSEDIVLSLGFDLSSVPKSIGSIEKILKNQKLVANIAFQFGTSQGEVRKQFKNFLNTLNNDVKANPIDLKLGSEDIIKTLPRLRYALYDISSGAQLVSQNLLAISSSVVTVAKDYETAFTNVQRVTNLTNDEAVSLRQELVNLGNQIPISFKEITEIATLGAQLGIAEQNLTSFTSTVSKFSAVTGISVEESAAAFGSLGELLNVTSAQYENLGSAITYVGFNSVATEKQIITLAQKLAASATNAGFTADQVIGLAGAFASLKIAPERAQGVMEIYFKTLNTAIAENGPMLQNFANIAGVSAEQVGELVKTDPQGFFRAFSLGLGSLDPIGLTQALDAVGLSGIRAGEVFTRVSGDIQLFDKSFSDAAQSFPEASALSDAFSLKVDDLASKIQLLDNAFKNLGDSVGSNLLGPFGFIIDSLRNLVVGFEQVAKTPIGGIFLSIVVGAVALIGALFGLVAVTLTAAGGIAATVVALSLLRKAAPGATGATGLIASGFTALGFSAGAATAAVTALRVVLALTGVGAIIGVLTAFAGAAYLASDAADGTTGSVGELTDAQGRTQAQIDAANAVIDEQNAKLSELGGTGGTAASATKAIRTLGDYADDLSSVFSRAFEIRFSSITSLDSISKSFSSIAKSTSDARQEIDSLNADIQSLEADQALQRYFLTVAEAYGDTLNAQAIRANLAKIDNDLTNKTKTLSDAQSKTNKTLVGNTDAAIDNRSEIIGLVKNYEDYIKTLASSGIKQEELATKTSELKADFIAQATQLGYNEVELQKYSSAFDDVKVSVDNVPRNVTIEADINPAITALNEFVAKAKQAGADAGDGAATNFEQEFQPHIPPIEVETVIKSPSVDNWKNLQKDILSGGQSQINLGKTWGAFWSNFTKLWTLNQGFGYSEGGYTGAGGKLEPAGIVHRGEYVVPKEQVNQATGMPYFMSQPRSFAQGGFVGGNSGSGMVSLSPEDRALLRNVGGSGNIVLYADSKELARSVNDGNRQIVASGGRP